MRNSKLGIIYTLVAITLIFTSCSDDAIEVLEQENIVLEQENEVLVQQNNLQKSGIPDFGGRFIQTDRLARPIISIFLVPPGDSSEEFNMTPPSELAPVFEPLLLAQIEGLSPAFSDPGDQNVLGQTAVEFADFLAADVLNVSTIEPTIFSTSTLTGRKLNDDIITTVLQWIFGGEDLSENPGLSDDNVDANDVPFLDHFPYLARPF